MSGAPAIFVTGAASGIGRAIAQEFASRGWFLGLADLNEAGLAETAALLGVGRSASYRLDVRSREAWDLQLAAFVEAAGGRLNALANNAGVARGGPFESLSGSDDDLLIDVNFRGVVNGCRAALPYLKQNPGSVILNTGSASGLYGSAGLSVYSATKFAVRGLTEALDIEFEPYGVRVRSIMPGFIDTPLLTIGVAGSNRSARDSVVDAGLEFTPVETVARLAWEATQGDKVHTLIGKTAEKLAFWARWAPGSVRKQMKKQIFAAHARAQDRGGG
ncbi:MAG: SDR family oxidoreductase [Alphaproteobacteria bacterium]|jgi:NAD(P)-dependent dehydrogenase (short-subunit alcohol dehydrogenase family)|nr:SDR family oxidoreductase [Alphaproteobacteria bacterium]